MTYLHQRGITLSPHDAPAVLRYHPSLLYKDVDGGYTYHPAMVAKVQDPNGQSVSIHRTYLTADGRKAPVSAVKKLMSAAVPRGTVGGAGPFGSIPPATYSP